MEMHYPGVTGSVTNYILSTNPGDPVAGTWMTELLHTERQVYFVEYVDDSGRTVIVTRARCVILIDGKGQDQAYQYERDPKAERKTLRHRRGRWHWVGIRGALIRTYIVWGIAREHRKSTFDY